MNVEQLIERYIVEEIMFGNGQTKLEPEQSLISSGILDSVALLRLIAFIEEQFGVKITDGEVIPDNFETLNNIKTFLEQKLQIN